MTALDRGRKRSPALVALSHLNLPDPAQHKKLVWEIEKKLVEDDARPILFYPRGTICWQPQLKGLTIMVNSIYNGSRYEDLWFDN